MNLTKICIKFTIQTIKDLGPDLKIKGKAVQKKEFFHSLPRYFKKDLTNDRFEYNDYSLYQELAIIFADCISYD